MNCVLISYSRDDEGTIRIGARLGDVEVSLRGTVDGDDAEVIRWAVVPPEPPANDGKPRAGIPKRYGTDRWGNAGRWLAALANPAKVAEFAEAVGSKIIQGAVPLPVLDHRHQCCTGQTITGIQVDHPCRHMHEDAQGKRFCRACGCPDWKASDLRAPSDNPQRSKLAYPALECPIGRWNAWKEGEHDGAA